MLDITAQPFTEVDGLDHRFLCDRKTILLACLKDQCVFLDRGQEPLDMGSDLFGFFVLERELLFFVEITVELYRFLVVGKLPFDIFILHCTDFLKKADQFVSFRLIPFRGDGFEVFF